MDKKAQAGLEYLMTYGWALVFVATVIGVLVMSIGSMGSDIEFKSSAPTKLMLKGAVQETQGNVEITVQNITGGPIKITRVALTGDYIGEMTLNGVDVSTISSSNPYETVGGGTLTFEGIEYLGGGQVEAGLEIEFRDAMGFSQTETIIAKGTSPPIGQEITQCGITLDEPGEKYYLKNEIDGTENCITINASDVTLNCLYHGILGNGFGEAIRINEDNATIKNCYIETFQTGIYLNHSNNTEISETQVAFMSTGIQGQYSDNIVISGSGFIYNSFTGANLNNCDNWTVTNSKFNNNNSLGITMYTCNNVTLTGNEMKKNGTRGVEGGFSTGITLNNNTVCNNTGTDIYCVSSGFSATGNTADTIQCTGVTASTACS